MICISSRYSLQYGFSISSHLSEWHTNNFVKEKHVYVVLTVLLLLWNSSLIASTCFINFFFLHLVFFFLLCYSIPREDKSNSHMNVIVNTEHGQRDWSVVSGKNYDSVIIAGLWRMTSCHMIQCIMGFNLSC